MQLLAEGVETAKELEFLKSKGCTRYQGYYFYKPTPSDGYQALITNAAPV